MPTLFFKTETTAIPRFGKKATDSSQPRVMQLSALIVDGKRVERGMMCSLFRPDQWVSTADAAKAHGISQLICEKYGVRPHAALASFMDMVRCSREIVAFGFQFHAFMIDIELSRLGDAGSTPEAWSRPGLKRTCAMAAAAAIATSGKSIKLAAAHDAMVETPYVSRQDLYDDLRAVARIHFACIDRGF